MSALTKDKIKLLLVDDSSAINEMNKYFFEKSSPKIIIDVARNGLEAINHLEENEILPKLILLDLKMPVLDGLEFLKTLSVTKTEEELEEFKIILLTTSMNPEDQKRAKSYSFVVDYMAKPLSLVQVKSITENYLS